MVRTNFVTITKGIHLTWKPYNIFNAHSSSPDWTQELSRGKIVQITTNLLQLQPIQVQRGSMYSHKKNTKNAKISFCIGCLIQKYPNIHYIDKYQICILYRISTLYTFWTNLIFYYILLNYFEQHRSSPFAPSGWSASLTPEKCQEMFSCLVGFLVELYVIFKKWCPYAYLWSTNIAPKSVDQEIWKSNHWLVVARSLLSIAGRVHWICLELQKHFQPYRQV